MAHDYRLALRARGIKPLPPVNKLRTAKVAGDLEQTPIRHLSDAGFYRHGDTANG